MKEIIIKPINYKIPLRQVLYEDFKSIGRELPIKGGWGYSIEDAIIIDKNDPSVDRSIPFDGISLEYLIVEKRIYEELIIFRSRDDRYSGIKWELLRQELISNKNKYYDKLTFKITAHKRKDFESLKKDWENNYFKPEFNKEEHWKKHNELLCFYESVYWFDITSFF